MRIHGVEMPDALTEAVEENRLVVFAGAGVSMQPPGPLPDFTELVEEITRAVRPGQPPMQRIGNERYESYLGCMGEAGQLKEACARIMGSDTPSDLHANILRLFGGGILRLVTTNYDLRFERAADALGMSVRSFSSPALPLGNDFSGIVHLHGDVTHPGELILVDADYGSAYVSDGWVTRFLVKMFQSYMVLFVGYSLSDVPMQYLARSISGELQNRVFVLEMDSSSFDTWRRRGITPIPFERYEQLPELFREWGMRVLRTQDQRMAAVARIAGEKGPLTDYDSEPLRKAFEAMAQTSSAVTRRPLWMRRRALGATRCSLGRAMRRSSLGASPRTGTKSFALGLPRPLPPVATETWFCLPKRRTGRFAGVFRCS